MVPDLRRKLAALLSLVLALSCFTPGYAIADDWYMGLQTVYTNDNMSSYDCVVIAPNGYAAAAYVFGSYPQLLTEEQKSALSDSSFCPNFCEYASTFQEFDPLSPPGWLPAYFYAALVGGGVGVALFGNKRLCSSASNFLFQDAKEEFQAVLSGDIPDGGGSSGGSSSGPDLVLVCSDSGVTKRPSSLQVFQVNGVDYYVNEQIVDGANYSRYAPDITLKLVGDALTTYNNLMEQNDNLKLYFFSDYGTVFRGIVVLTDAELTTTDASSSDGGTSFNYKQYSFGTGNFYTLNGSDFGTQYSFTDNHDGTLSTSIAFRSMSGYRRTKYSPTSSGWNTYTSVGDSSSAPSAPSGDWPDDPVVTEPTSPELPEPDSNTMPQEPTDTNITINLPDITVTGGESATDLTDVISILKVINANLVNINDNLEDEFNSVLNAFRAIGGQLEQIGIRLREHCQHIRTAIYQNTTHIENELYKLFHWLKDQLDFGFDDSSIVGYLQRILEKIGSITYQPNPVADPFNFFDWLMGLLGGFLASLVSGLPGVLQDLLTDLSTLTEYFPFSMPWDVYGLLLLFAHDPVTPVFDLPWNFAANHTAQIHIDLSQYDGIMSIVRAVEKVIFAAGLAVFTMKMFKPTDVLGDE